MKRQFVIFAFFVLTSKVCAQVPYTNLKDAGLAGPIKEIVEQTYNGIMKSQNDLTERSEKYVTEFDELGNIISQEGFDQYGARMIKLIYDYTNTKQVVVSILGQTDSLRQKSVYIFDDRNRLISSQGSGFATIYIYNKLGNKIGEQSFSSGVLKRNKVINYLHNRKCKELAVDPEGKILYSLSYIYDKIGKVKQITITDNSDDINAETVIRFYEFDKYYNWTFNTSAYTTKSSTGKYSTSTFVKRTIKYY